MEGVLVGRTLARPVSGWRVVDCPFCPLDFSILHIKKEKEKDKKNRKNRKEIYKKKKKKAFRK